ncbi:lipoprotein insertase outer membrane protein LolB [Larsenimonas suaedae]|uniref:Outer-membrane lipoprotein LolB n=1 Tax=Larsenimonas suaedae TaxID=1851019 RepID=A0ABU1GWI2_9GAMM|nr:lipoprotein insertase outer membrane protein LolB [Larsenimonas suaedae]MCM2970969.1 lipoprotein insertase outer membrane protein LolB [Larsenimonas suaedae]MDR5895678.1 lipoprotein insertase outer membrane protein LolB [Larsenimonas suaedae]
MRRLMVIAAFALIAGCATQAPGPNGTRHIGDWKSQQTQIEALDAWTLMGKVALSAPDTHQSANLDWTQAGTHYRMLLTGPFGAGRTTLDGEPGNVSLSNSEGTFSAPSPEALMQSRLGWSLPVSALDHWVKAEPAPHSDSNIERDELGFPKTLEQDGWTITYSKWTNVDSLWLPGRISMIQGELRVVMIVTKWQPEAGK